MRFSGYDLVYIDGADSTYAHQVPLSSVPQTKPASNNLTDTCAFIPLRVTGPTISISTYKSSEKKLTYKTSSNIKFIGTDANHAAGFGGFNGSYNFRLSGTQGWMDISGIYYWCLTGYTLITMADGSQKRLDEICIGDEILSYDWNTMSLISNKVIYTDKDENKQHDRLDRYTFDDGTVIDTVHRHEFYNWEVQSMKYMDEWNIGEHAIKQDGSKVELISHETIMGTIRHYKITGEKGTNYFANGLLTGDRYCPKNIKL